MTSEMPTTRTLNDKELAYSSLKETNVKILYHAVDRSIVCIAASRFSMWRLKKSDGRCSHVS